MTETKWEAVEHGDIKPGDKVRLLHANGDVIHGVWYGERGKAPSGISTVGGICMGRHWSLEHGYRFERAVPERTLPTEPGLYEVPGDDARLFNLNDDEQWATDDGGEAWRLITARDVPLTIVRLVPVTEVEEAEKRGVRKVEDELRLRFSLSSADIVRRAFPEAFDGEA